MTTSSAVTVLALKVEMPIVLTVALMVVNVLVSIVEFALRVSTVKDVSEMEAMARVLTARVLKTAFGPFTVLTVRVDWIVVPLAERVLKKAVAPMRVLAMRVLAMRVLAPRVLVVRVLMAALLPTNVLAVRVLIAAVSTVRVGRFNVSVVSVLKVAFVPVSVLT
jgi:hypothetical protein